MLRSGWQKLKQMFERGETLKPLNQAQNKALPIAPGHDSLVLFFCGAAILYWELVLIRWMGGCIRVVAYFSNFILIAAFFGLGVGALLTARKFRLETFLIPAISFCLLLGPFLGLFSHGNPTSALEFIWIGRPNGILPNANLSSFLGFSFSFPVKYWVLLVLCFLVVTFTFVVFGQMVGILFTRMPPLKAYSIEIGGSLSGIVLFGLISLSNWPPTLWFISGFILTFLILTPNVKHYLFAVLCCLVVFYACGKFERNFIWSPYYKIAISPIDRLHDIKNKTLIGFNKLIGYQVSVNNDYHQMIIDLHDRPEEHDFFKSWRLLYDYPYLEKDDPQEGPILILGAGTGNDVSAALRNTKEQIDVVEIDPQIVRLGRILHLEEPYADRRVHVIVDDARSYLENTRKKYAKVVFGFLDSHTLLSSFSSVRLDNFVYTLETMQKVKEILIPGGKVYLTFASNTWWIHKRIIRLMNSAFDLPTEIRSESRYGYSNGVIYINAKRAGPPANPGAKGGQTDSGIKIPTDDWPFLYLKTPSMPGHYITFIFIVLILSVSSLLLLPRVERVIRLKYFFMGAGFFLVETSNVVKLSLLYGSTWVVNVVVFSGILAMILLGNLACTIIKKDNFPLWFALLIGSGCLSYAFQPSDLLKIDSVMFQGMAAVGVFLSPIFFAALIFAKLIWREEELFSAYGSNLLGAMVGGASEYLSLVWGFQFLVLVSMVFYMLAFLWIIRRPRLA